MANARENSLSFYRWSNALTQPRAASFLIAGSVKASTIEGTSFNLTDGSHPLHYPLLFCFCDFAHLLSPLSDFVFP